MNQRLTKWVLQMTLHQKYGIEDQEHVINVYEEISAKGLDSDSEKRKQDGRIFTSHLR